MTKYPIHPMDLSHLKTIPLQARGGKVRVSDFASPYRKGAGVAAWLDSLPHILAGDSLRAVVAAIAAARVRRRAIIWGLGGHVIKCGLAPVLIDLMGRGYATAFAMNGAAAIHDLKSRSRATPARMWKRCCPTGASARPRKPDGR